MPATATPVRWARYGIASRWLAALLPTRRPPVLILSLGRSGSTWVSQTLGRAADALLLHEPLTQPLLASGGSPATNFDIDPAAPPSAYAANARAAFAGLPAFEPQPPKATAVVRLPQQWALSQRARRRLVIKEINPFACAWLVKTYQPRVIYLVRHPAAVALSNARLGFLQGDEIWPEQGRHQGRAHAHARQTLDAYSACRYVIYEDLCARPLALFRELYDFAGLAWDGSIERDIEANSRDGDRSNPWGTARNSQAMIRDWEGQVSSQALAALRAAYAQFDLPWYQSDDDWE